ncbi:cupin domain-containing protein [Tropicimonas sp. TH_r6]|uniref:cupin domain-containing protein n=1 Tax=Tropicimonas sp. TH_r6 TaxID=3082085 RepID=UPI0029537E2A|nr:cupin domain-containing protein [Tropicimonas sp. TH_r6]MDV7145928.1 cupin domain-containing protein [Tropicimonas sp. TH_r6]
MLGDSFVLKSGEGGVLIPEKQPSDYLEPYEALNFTFGVCAEIEEVGAKCGRGIVPPGAEVPVHAGDFHTALFVVSGRGHLVLYDLAGERTGQVPFEAGTLVVFPPGARHGWINESDEDFVWFGVDFYGAPA